MKLGARIFLCFVVIFAGCVYFPLDWVRDTLRTRYLEGVEDALVDSANLLAGVVEAEMQNGELDVARLQAALAPAYTRVLDARIYELQKQNVDLQVYVTDAAGRVLFDTRVPTAVGQSYLQWRDVQLTLDGRYGARSSLLDDSDIFSTALYVGAPIRRAGQIVGVLTVVKPTTNIQSFLRMARPAILQAGLLSLLIATLLSLGVSYGLTRPIQRLRRYADAVGRGQRVDFPDLGSTEIKDLGLALQRMQEALEGRRYADEYVQTLTHELKSPLSAIRAAAELLQEDMPAAQRTRFLANIRAEGERIARIVDRMLELSKLENRREAPEMTAVDVAAMVNTVVESCEPQLAAKHLQVQVHVVEAVRIHGNAFLLHQAFANLLQNAIDFSPTAGTVKVTARRDGSVLYLSVADDGPGVPDYAQDKIFERFYSLARPDSGKKSTGLGLNFVREVAHAHRGEVHLSNRPEGGLVAEIQLPI